MEEEFTMPAKVTKRKFEKEERKLELTNGYEKLGETAEPEHENDEEREQVSFKKPKIHREQRRSEKRTITKGQEEPKKPKIAPIFLKNKEKWTKISQKMSQAKITTTKCKLVNAGIQIDPAAEEDYRKLVHLLEKEGYQFFTYQLSSEKKLKVVLRGITQEITEKEITEDLQSKGYPADKVTRMNGKNGRPAPLVLLELSKEYKSIYELRQVCGLATQVEPLKTKTGVIQCHRCQLFGHVQRNCHIGYKCMKCGEDHSTHLCEKPKTKPPKCANCGGEHLSTAISCKKNPNNPTIGTKKQEAPAPKT
ncbi:hypothetical protein Trydic_g6725, partial [Trypoxylus dichotomus]